MKQDRSIFNDAVAAVITASATGNPTTAAIAVVTTCVQCDIYNVA